MATMDAGAQARLPVGTRVRTRSSIALGVNEEGLSAGLMGTVVAHEGLTNIGVNLHIELSRPGGQLIFSHKLGGILPGRTGLWFYEHELEVIEEARGMTGQTGQIGGTIAEPLPLAIPRLKVHIERDGYGEWAVRVENCADGWEQLTGQAVRSYLPKDQARKILRRLIWESRIERFVTKAIVAGVDADILAKAVYSAIESWQAVNSKGSYSVDAGAIVDQELARMLASEPPMMVIGDQLFSLYAQGKVTGTRGLSLMRKRIMDKAREASVRIIEVANRESGMMIRRGEKELERFRATVRQEQGELMAKIPDWVISNGIAVMPARGRTDGMKWMIGIKVVVAAEQIKYSDGVEWNYWWPLSPLADLANIYQRLWMPINFQTGEYRYNGTSDGARCEFESCCLPHISQSGCCMELQGLPGRITGTEHLSQVQSAISRGNKVINMNSLLVREAKMWHPYVQAQVNQAGTVVKDYIFSRNNVSERAAKEVARGAGNVARVRDEAVEVFELRDFETEAGARPR